MSNTSDRLIGQITDANDKLEDVIKELEAAIRALNDQNEDLRRDLHSVESELPEANRRIDELEAAQQ